MLRLYRLGLVLLAVGCSPVKDPSNVPDAAIDAMDTRPPMIASAIPADMGTKVSPLQALVIYLDEPLDPASVSATTVKLSYRPPPTTLLPFVNAIPTTGPGSATGWLRVKGTVSYDSAARKIVFDAAAPLVYGAMHQLQIDVKDTAQLGLTSTINFTTYVNSQTRQHFYNASGLPSSWVGNPTNMDGRWTKRVSGSSPGIDTIWFTADDPRNQHVAYNIAPDGRILEERNYTPGSDGQYDTPDDVVNICAQYKYDANKVLTERTYATAIGPDSMWCTMDDVPTYNYPYTYTGTTSTGYVWVTNPGTDSTWRTTDDRCTYYYDHEYDANGLRTREVLKSCAADGLSRTADDAPLQYYNYEYNADGLPIRQEFRIGIGPDNMWFTPDDIYATGSLSQPGITRWMRDGNGVVTETILSINVGTDAMWGTGDDPGNRTVTTNNADGLPEKVILYSSQGTDGVWGGTDDVIASYSKLTYEANGNRTDHQTFNAGTDGMWETGDDKVTSDLDFDINR